MQLAGVPYCFRPDPYVSVPNEEVAGDFCLNRRSTRSGRRGDGVSADNGKRIPRKIPDSLAGTKSASFLAAAVSSPVGLVPARRRRAISAVKNGAVRGSGATGNRPVPNGDGSEGQVSPSVFFFCSDLITFAR